LLSGWQHAACCVPHGAEQKPLLQLSPALHASPVRQHACSCPPHLQTPLLHEKPELQLFPAQHTWSLPPHDWQRGGPADTLQPSSGLEQSYLPLLRQHGWFAPPHWHVLPTQTLL